jgi:RHS repeat-associated protein
VGNWYEVTNGIATKYYYFGAQRVAMQTSAGVTYLHGDHLGSTSVASNGTTGALVSRQTYYAFDGVRTTEGALPTDYTFTGQKNDAASALMFYNARYYDTNIGRFTQADTIVPNIYNPQSLNRYAYVVNNPVKYVDPTGHDGKEYIPLPDWDDGSFEPADFTFEVKPPSVSRKESEIELPVKTWTLVVHGAFQFFTTDFEQHKGITAATPPL